MADKKQRVEKPPGAVCAAEPLTGGDFWYFCQEQLAPFEMQLEFTGLSQLLWVYMDFILDPIHCWWCDRPGVTSV